MQRSRDAVVEEQGIGGRLCFLPKDRYVAGTDEI